MRRSLSTSNSVWSSSASRWRRLLGWDSYALEMFCRPVRENREVGLRRLPEPRAEKADLVVGLGRHERRRLRARDRPGEAVALGQVTPQAPQPDQLIGGLYPVGG